MFLQGGFFTRSAQLELACSRPETTIRNTPKRYYCGYNNSMRFTRDPAKNGRDIAERGIAFDLAEQFDWSAALIAEDTRKDYPERRYQALGSISEHLHMLVFTPRDGAVHVVSLRRANKRERTRYGAQAQP